MILAGLTCVAHGRPLPGNLGLDSKCLLVARLETVSESVRSRPVCDTEFARKESFNTGEVDISG